MRADKLEPVRTHWDPQDKGEPTSVSHHLQSQCCEWSAKEGSTFHHGVDHALGAELGEDVTGAGGADVWVDLTRWASRWVTACARCHCTIDLQSIKKKEKKRKAALSFFTFQISHKISLVANTKSEPYRKKNYRKCTSGVANVTQYRATATVMVVSFKNKQRQKGAEVSARDVLMWELSRH